MNQGLAESDSPQRSGPKRQYYPEAQVRNDEEQINYYNQYCRLFLANHVLATQLKELSIEKVDLLSKLQRLEKKAQELSEGNSGQLDEKKRRVRRAAVDIARHYKCPVDGCSKSYGSQGSLNQHIKLKHPQVFRGGEQEYTVREYDQEDEDEQSC